MKQRPTRRSLVTAIGVAAAASVLPPRRARSVRLVDPTVTVPEFRAIVLRLAEREAGAVPA